MITEQYHHTRFGFSETGPQAAQNGSGLTKKLVLALNIYLILLPPLTLPNAVSLRCVPHAWPRSAQCALFGWCEILGLSL